MEKKKREGEWDAEQKDVVKIDRHTIIWSSVTSNLFSPLYKSLFSPLPLEW